MNKKNPYFENEVFRTWLEEEGYCVTRVKANSFVSIDHARENTEFVKSLGEILPILVDTRFINSITKEARDHFAMRGRKPGVNAIAILISSPVSRLIGNFYMGLNHPSVPTKLFTDEKKAIKWLLEFV